MLKLAITPAAIEAGINLNAMLHIDDPDFTHPTIADVHALKDASGWTRGKIAARLGTKDKAVDKWLAAGASSHQPIPYTAWVTWLLDSGLCYQENPPCSANEHSYSENPHTCSANEHTCSANEQAADYQKIITLGNQFLDDVFPQLGRIALQDYAALNELAMLLTKHKIKE